ncbi:cell migration-inducing and hyaluronan-binding protein-like isoform X1 [Dendronephthya gigantea]|uniref:cell migration-inducing and hyaluronan-binding protein-like isoform X1 n=1 Tax=Dendronephthya gigantea TaxID=151771 RepID=UPI00106DCA7D|nr:cell migration-inducing and hyaluronan-binding protein-like isoform X1 [Dendronephthya gigantea]
MLLLYPIVGLLLLQLSMTMATGYLEKFFKKSESVPLLTSTHIISSHSVRADIDCAFDCLEQSTCVGFKYKYGSTSGSINCQLSITIYTGKDQLKSLDDQGWVFFKDTKIILLHIHVASSGYNDPGGFFAHIRVNGKDYAINKRGFNIVVIDIRTGDVENSTSFDTYHGHNEISRMVQFLNTVLSQTKKLILAAINDEGSGGMTQDAYDALSEAAGENVATLGFRSSFAMIGFSDKPKPYFVRQIRNVAGQGPSVLQETIEIKL